MPKSIEPMPSEPPEAPLPPALPSPEELSPDAIHVAAYNFATTRPTFDARELRVHLASQGMLPEGADNSFIKTLMKSVVAACNERGQEATLHIYTRNDWRLYGVSFGGPEIPSMMPVAELRGKVQQALEALLAGRGHVSTTELMFYVRQVQRAGEEAVAVVEALVTDGFLIKISSQRFGLVEGPEQPKEPSQPVQPEQAALTNMPPDNIRYALGRLIWHTARNGVLTSELVDWVTTPVYPQRRAFELVKYLWREGYIAVYDGTNPKDAVIGLSDKAREELQGNWESSTSEIIARLAASRAVSR